MIDYFVLPDFYTCSVELLWTPLSTVRHWRNKLSTATFERGRLGMAGLPAFLGMLRQCIHALTLT
jgi:hypothetical protein